MIGPYCLSFVFCLTRTALRETYGWPSILLMACPRDELALERAMQASLAQPVSLAARHRAIQLLARARYEDPSLPSSAP